MSIFEGTYGNPRLDLGQAVNSWFQDETAYIATKVFPIFRTAKKAANYPALTKDSMTRLVDTNRSTGGNYSRDRFEAEDRSFACVEKGHEVPLCEDEAALYSDDFSAEVVSAKIAAMRVLDGLEVAAAAAAFNTTTFTGGKGNYTDISSTAPFASASSAVKTAIVTARLAVRALCGMMPDTLVVNRTNFENLTKLTEVKASIQYVKETTDENIKNAMAAYFGLKKVLVAEGVKNTAKKSTSLSGSEIWSSSYALLGVIPEDGQNLILPSIGRTFLWTKDSPNILVTEDYEEKQTRSKVYRARHNRDIKIVDEYLGHLLKVA